MKAPIENFKTLAARCTRAELVAMYAEETGSPVPEDLVENHLAHLATLNIRASYEQALAHLIQRERSDHLGIKAKPRDGFVLPEEGTKVVLLAPYKVCSRVNDPRFYVDAHEKNDFDGIVPAGTEGVVVEIRTPGVPCHGYVGCVIQFMCDHPYYPFKGSGGGVVIPWDIVDEPTLFRFGEG